LAVSYSIDNRPPRKGPIGQLKGPDNRVGKKGAERLPSVRVATTPTRPSDHNLIPALKDRRTREDDAIAYGRW